MRPGYRHRASPAHLAVKPYDEVIAYVGKTARKVRRLDLGVGKFLALRRGGAVQNDFIYFAPTGGNAQRGPCPGTDNAVRRQPLGLLQLLDRFLGQRSENAVGHEVQFPLQGLDLRASAAFP